MSDLKEKATELWSQLVQAMHADGILATSITQSGPATTAVIVNVCQAGGEVIDNTPWLKMAMKPQPGVEVVARDADGHLFIVSIDHGGRWHLGNRLVRESRFTDWRFLK